MLVVLSLLILNSMARYRKLIESSQEKAIVCDNPNCDFEITSNNNDASISAYINVACPKCGRNLLTQHDYDQYLALIKSVNWINKYFSWISIFISEKSKSQKIKAHVHDGVKMSKV